MRQCKNSIEFTGFFILTYLISPVICFIFACKNFKYNISNIFIVLFFLYFGFSVNFHNDLDVVRHIGNINKYDSLSIFDIINSDFIWRNEIKDVYHVILKYISSRFLYSENIFLSLVIIIYYGLFLLVLKNLVLFCKYPNVYGSISLLGVIFAIEFYWFSGVRFYTGVYFFLLNYVLYLYTGHKKYLYISHFSFLFHFSLIVLPVCYLLSSVIKNIKYSYFAIFVVSFSNRLFNVDFVSFLKPYTITHVFFKNSVMNDSIRNSVLNFSNYMRNDGNAVYRLRDEAVLCCLLIILFNLYKKNKDIFLKYSSVLGFICVLMSFANFGYADITFYERTLKISLILINILIYIIFNHDKCRPNMNRSLSFIFAGSVFFMFLTQVVQWREYLFDFNFLFSNPLIKYVNYILY